MMKQESILFSEAYLFAIRIVNVYKFLKNEKKELTLAKQLLRSGTSIGANISEAQDSPSNADFANKLNIALKEARETAYWLTLLKDTEYIDQRSFDSVHADCMELIKLLITVIKKLRTHPK